MTSYKPSQQETIPPKQHTPATQQTETLKLSVIISQMALQLLKVPDAVPSEPAAKAILILANAA